MPTVAKSTRIAEEEPVAPVPLEPRVVRAIPISKQAKAEAAADPAPASPASEAMAQMRQKLLPELEPLPAAVLPATNLPPHARLFQQGQLAASVPSSEPPWPTPTAPSKPPEPPAPPKPSKHASAADEDERPHNVCSKYGGHKVTFMRNHHELWRCVYPHHLGQR